MSERSSDTQVIGIDCATDPRRVGLARGNLVQQTITITEAVIEPTHEFVTIRLQSWIDQARRSLIALDAPLGWPIELGAALVKHQAGEPLNGLPNNLFRRATDRFIKNEFDITPLDVGAALIARTAHAALALLKRLRATTGLRIPLTWDRDFDGVAAIEVYPHATLKALGLRTIGYKKSKDRGRRMEICRGLTAHMNITAVEGSVCENADKLDAVVCVLAGFDFLKGRAWEPNCSDQEREREGWIWVRNQEPTRESVR